jgi:hypothetical protein
MNPPSGKKEKLWNCPECGRGFANRNQSHFCGRHSLDHHFEGKTAEARAIFEAFVSLLNEFGPVTVLPEKTRVAFQVRMSFAAVCVRRTYLIGHLVLARRVEDPLFTRVDTISPRNHVHHFRITRVSDMNAAFKRYAKDAYAVGEQKHLSAGER